MNKRNNLRGLTLLLVIIICTQPGWAFQNRDMITGKIVDAFSGNPVAKAAAFINNSTYVCICDENGVFRLEHFPLPPFELTITAMGYETSVVKVASGSLSPLLIRVKVKNRVLDEVTITGPDKDGWARYGKDFIRDFIGYSDFAKQCELLNKEVLEFRYDSRNIVLSVSAKEPLHIRNKATGYEITYWLEDFEKDYSTRKLYFKGYSLFTPLNTKKERVERRWKEQRKTAYYGSLNHFMRSIYEGSVEKEGFEIRRLIRVKGTEYGRYAPVSTGTFALNDQDSLKHLLEAFWGQRVTPDILQGYLSGLLEWAGDSTAATKSLRITDSLSPETAAATKQYTFTKNKGRLIAAYFDYKSLPPDRLNANKVLINGVEANKFLSLKKQYDILYTDLLNSDSFATREAGKPFRFRFQGYLQITFTREMEEQAYLATRDRVKKIVPGRQNSVISLAENTELTIDADGNFYNPYDLMIEQYWSYEKLDKLLPLDYRP